MLEISSVLDSQQMLFGTYPSKGLALKVMMSLHFGHGEHFSELKFFASFDDEVRINGLGNAIHTSMDIKEESLQAFGDNVSTKMICEDIGDSRFCIIADEACDDKGKEQIALILRCVGIL